MRFAHSVAVRSQNYPLVNQRFERLVKVQVTHVPQSLGDETCVQKVHAGVFRTADVLVHGKHFVNPLRIEGFFGIVSVGITQIIPTAAHKGVQRVRLSGGFGAALGTGYVVNEFFVFCKRTCSVGTEFHVIGKFDGKIFVQHLAAMGTIDDGNGRTPIALTGYQPVTQTVVGLYLAFALLGKFFHHGNTSLFAGDAVKFAAVAHNAVVAKGQAVVHVGRSTLYYTFYFKIVLFCKLVVPFVMSGNAHYCACAVTCQDVVAYPHLHLFAVGGVDGKRSREHTRFFLCGGKTLHFVGFGNFILVRLHRILKFRRGDFVYKRMFRRKYHVGTAEKCVGTGGEHLETAATVGKVEFYFAAHRFSYPVALHCLCLFRPIQRIQPRKQFLGVIGNFEKPLCKVLFYHLTVATLAVTVHHLFVGKHGVATRTPVDRCLFAVRQTFFVQLAENPLRPLVVIGQTGFYFVIPIENCADVFELLFHNGNVFQRAVLGMNACFYCVVFRRQSESVKTHGLKHVFALHYLIPCKGVGKSVVVPMPDVQFGSAGIGKHFQHVILVVDVLWIEGINFLFLPQFVPLLFNCYFVHKCL